MSKKNFIVYDVETKDLIQKDQKTEELEISVLGWYNSTTKEISVVDELDLHIFFEEVKETDLIVGFNHIDFDNKIIRKYDHDGVIDSKPQFDMMKLAQNILGHRVGLNAIAKASLGQSKGGHGSLAPKLWKEGRLEELQKYLYQDITLTKDIFIKGLKEDTLSFESKKEPYDTKTFDTTGWLDKARDLMYGRDKVENILKEHGYSAVDVDEVIQDLRRRTNPPISGGAPKKRLTTKRMFPEYFS